MFLRASDLSPQRPVHCRGPPPHTQRSRAEDSGDGSAAIPETPHRYMQRNFAGMDFRYSSITEHFESDDKGDLVFSSC